MFIIVSIRKFYTEETMQLQGCVWEGYGKESNHPLFKANIFGESDEGNIFSSLSSYF